MIRSNQNVLRLHQLAAATALLLAGTTAHAAARTDLHQADLAQVNHQYRLATQGMVSVKPEQRHAELVGLDSESRLTVLTHRVDKDGTNHYRYQQTFRGIPIFGEQIIVSEGRGIVRNLFGRKVDGLAAQLPRNAALMAWGAAQRDTGHAVQVCALYAPWTATRGTAHAAGLAREHGLVVTELTASPDLMPDTNDCTGGEG